MSREESRLNGLSCNRAQIDVRIGQRLVSRVGFVVLQGLVDGAAGGGYYLGVGV